MNRARMQDETYEDYKKSLKEEAAALKHYLKGRIIWTASIVVDDSKDTSPIQALRRKVKLRVRGAFNRLLGHRMPNSEYEKQKAERVAKKLRKKGIFK